MTLQEFRDLLLTADPAAAHYKSPGKKTNYTIWREYGAGAMAADDAHQETSWRIQVDRFTKAEYDPVADAIRAALNGHPDISFAYEIDYEHDTGYIHHIFDCEVA